MDPRGSTVAYYDLAPDFPEDIPFYAQQITSSTSTVLELGCGTGRVSVALAPRVGFLQGVDLSPAMVAQCQVRLRDAGLPPSQAQASLADITNLDLGRRFDLLIAPYRVIQNLTTDRQIDGLFSSIGRHLATGGRCILNVFRPYADAETLFRKWSVPREDVDWELPVPGGRVVCSVRRAGATADPLVLYPNLIYRRYEGEVQVDEAVASIAMRCWYPDEFLERIRQAGFTIAGKWGGYAGEAYGTGTELIAAMKET